MRNRTYVRNKKAPVFASSFNHGSKSLSTYASAYGLFLNEIYFNFEPFLEFSNRENHQSHCQNCKKYKSKFYMRKHFDWIIQGIYYALKSRVIANDSLLMTHTKDLPIAIGSKVKLVLLCKG